MIAPKLRDLTALTDEKLRKLYDDKAPQTQVGTSFILDELRSRQNARLGKQMLRLTYVMTFLTAVVTIATVINVVVFLQIETGTTP